MRCWAIGGRRRFGGGKALAKRANRGRGWERGEMSRVFGEQTGRQARVRVRVNK